MTSMTRVPVDSGSLNFSRIIYGCWRMADKGQDTSPKAVARRIETCLEHGITTFDHADIYGGYEVETIFGAALKQTPSLKSRMEIITKCGIKLVSPARPGHALKTYDVRAEHIVTSTDNSLRTLGVESIELLLLHRPSPLLDPHEVAAAFSRLHKEGKVKAFGVSNFLPHQVEMLRTFSPLPLVANQFEFHCLRPQPAYDGTLDQCLRIGMLPMAWSPLAGGRLGAASAGQGPSNADTSSLRAKLETIGRRHETGGEQVALAWIMTHPAGISPVIGTQRNERIGALARAVDVTLSQDEWFEVLAAAEGKEVP